MTRGIKLGKLEREREIDDADEDEKTMKKVKIR
jgi:hypothetical protein